MKKVLFIISIALISSINQNQAIYAQEVFPKNIINVDLLRLIIPQYQFSFERIINNKFSAGLSIGYIRKKDYYTEFGSTIFYISKTSGYIFIPNFKFYVKQMAPKGFYVEPFIIIKFLSIQFLDSSVASRIYFNNTMKDVPNISHNEKRNSLGGGIVIGYNHFIGDHVNIDYFVGFNYISTKEQIIHIDDPYVSEEEIQGWLSENESREDFQNSIFDIDNILRLGVKIGIAF